MRLALGSRTYDLATRALVLGTDERAVDQGADLVELASPDAPSPVPLCLLATDDLSLGWAIARGAELIRLRSPTVAAYGMCATAGVAVVVPAGQTGAAAAAGLEAERILSDALLVDVTGVPSPLAAMVAGVIRGARILRTDDVRAARRVCDVLAAIAEAGPR